MLGKDAFALARECECGKKSENEASVADESLQSDIHENGENVAEPIHSSEDPRHEGATPPGYDWPTHGGYLGCLLAVIFACLLAPLGYIVVGFLGALLSQPLGAVGVGIAVVVTVVGYLALFIGLTRLGWSVGKRFLREYPQPVRPVWGEDDDMIIVDADSPKVVDADQANREDAVDGGSEKTTAR